VGALAGGAGAVLLFTSPKKDTPRASFFVGPGSVGAAGTF
jgi:hypothetical protein